ncbi:hypothetical protein C0989_001500 [Termitomyces sp. Mn162]|nr:hypothetical protein C0989_001500 [Termitomyces sp. Mn162]
MHTMGFFRRLLNLLRPRARTSVTDHDHWDKHRERRGHRYRHTHANRDSELSRYPSQDRTSVTSHGRPSMTYEPPSMTYEPPSMTHEQPPMTSDERYRTPYNEQPPTSTRRHHDAQFFTALPSAPFSPVALPGTSGNLPTIGRLDPPGALGILMHDEQQHNQEERPNLYRTIPLPSVTSTPGNSPVSNNQAVSASMVPPQANHLGPEESSPDAGNSTSLLFESPVQGITYEIPQYLHLVKNLKIESPISIRRFLSILTCSHLEMFSVTTNEDDVTHAVDFSGRVPAGNLISLSIVTSVESKLLLDRFMARNLRIFHLEWNSQGSRIPIPNSADIGIDLFVKQSGCRLNMLSLVNLYIDEVQLVNCLKLNVSAHLHTLVIRNNSFSGILTSSSGRVVTDMTLRTLSQSNGGVPLCPRLSRLEITSCFASDGMLVSMVRARNVKNKQTFSLHYSFGAQGEGQSLHPMDKFGLAEFARKYNFTITEGPQLSIPL